MTTTPDAPSPADAPRRRLPRVPRWLVITLVTAVAIGVAGLIIARALPNKAEVQVEIAGRKLPASVVISSDDLKSQFPGLVLGSILGKSTIQINAGDVTAASGESLSVKSWSGGKTVRYRVTGTTRFLDASRPLSIPPRADDLRAGTTVAVATATDSDEALLVITGVKRD